ncbi:MAG: hypothetical protein KC652_28880, partial [Cyanobacteria bacterium HKST-UBA01]|nr:hypothetical protein [Cyanobacteria bacterium HKST-UBA01]
DDEDHSRRINYCWSGSRRGTEIGLVNNYPESNESIEEIEKSMLEVNRRQERTIQEIDELTKKIKQVIKEIKNHVSKESIDSTTE